MFYAVPKGRQKSSVGMYRPFDFHKSYSIVDENGRLVKEMSGDDLWITAVSDQYFHEGYLSFANVVKTSSGVMLQDVGSVGAIITSRKVMLSVMTDFSTLKCKYENQGVSYDGKFLSESSCVLVASFGGVQVPVTILWDFYSFKAGSVSPSDGSIVMHAGYCRKRYVSFDKVHPCFDVIFDFYAYDAGRVIDAVVTFFCRDVSKDVIEQRGVSQGFNRLRFRGGKLEENGVLSKPITLGEVLRGEMFRTK